MRTDQLNLLTVWSSENKHLTEDQDLQTAAHPSPTLSVPSRTQDQLQSPVMAWETNSQEHRRQ